MQTFWYLRNLESTYQQRGKAVGWRFTVNKHARRGSVSLLGFYFAVCIFVNECCSGYVLHNLHDFLLWIMFLLYIKLMEWKRGLNSIITMNLLCFRVSGHWAYQSLLRHARCNLHARLDLFTTQEILDGEEKLARSKCHIWQQSTKKLSIYKFPTSWCYTWRTLWCRRGQQSQQGLSRSTQLWISLSQLQAYHHIQPPRHNVSGILAYFVSKLGLFMPIRVP